MDPCKPKGRELARRWSDTHIPPKQENVTRSIERKDVALLEYLLKNAAVAVQSSSTMEEKLLLQLSLCRVGSDEQKEACCQTQNGLENFDFTKLPPMILEALEKKAMEQMSELEQSITKLVSVLRPDFATCSSADGSKTSALDFAIDYLRNGYDVKSAQQHVEQERELLLEFDALSQRPEESSSGSCRADISKYMTALSAESLSLRREAESTLAEAE
ncbi:hypothetical protein TTRE_0000603001 [Trichuris trichiura]|uniref:Uncharacterized protein n=1 Tax=Trichuris trichiura TaxID=36087 RepID=A0A077ZGK5_TRITR|nr:hypothetical protein TTRE_0000603001 [Trichuris trichiura]